MLIVVAALTGLLLTLACRRWALRIGMLNYPNPIVAQHVAPVPYLGGLAVAASWLLTSAMACRFPALYPTQSVLFPPPMLWLGGTLFMLLGLLDDARPLSPLLKLSLQSAIALGLLVGLQSWHGGAVAVLSGVLLCAGWIVIIVNAVNVTDVCDGLITILGCIALLAIAVVRPDHAVSAIILLGTCLGFLMLNFPPARIYQGDAGSHFLGYLLAIMTLPEVATNQLTPAGFVFGVLLLGIFLFEVLFIVWMRLRKGLKWWRGSPDHFSLRMQAVGFSKQTTILLTMGAAVPWTLAAVLWEQQFSQAAIAAMLGLVVIESIVAWTWLRAHDVSAPMAREPSVPKMNP